MKNFPVIDPKSGKEFWISRAMAVLVGIVGETKAGTPCILAQKRGPKTPDPEFRGCWCLPCGYLDYDETLKEAAAREVFEETGLKLDIEDLSFWKINDDPNSDKRQNVTIRYTYKLNENIEDIKLTSDFSEDGEVSDIKWIDLRAINSYKWAFNHNKLAKEIGTYYYKRL